MWHGNAKRKDNHSVNNGNYNMINDFEPIYPIRTAAKLLGISIPTLRMYEKEGLIIPYKSDGNQRLYSFNDIQRIRDIRKDINENKISINGLRAIASLIPCWQIKNCDYSERENCQAYKEQLKPCWLYKHSGNICENNDCRECEVYLYNSDFEKIRDTIRKAV
jgi:MerR family transcriptional regulator/heat shock protein HspR